MRKYQLENKVFLRTAFLNEDQCLPPWKKKKSGHVPEWKHDLNPNLFAKKAPSYVASLSLGCSNFLCYFWRPPSDLWTFLCLVLIPVKSNKQVLKSPYISFCSVEVCFQVKPSSKLLPFICLPQRLPDAAGQLCPMCSCRHALQRGKWHISNSSDDNGTSSNNTLIVANRNSQSLW